MRGNNVNVEEGKRKTEENIELMRMKKFRKRRKMENRLNAHEEKMRNLREKLKRKLKKGKHQKTKC